MTSYSIKFRRLLIIVSMFLLPISSAFTFAADSQPAISPVPGGLVAIRIQADSKPVVKFKNRQVMLLQGDSEYQWVALVGIPLSTVPGNHSVQMNETESISFKVVPKEYESQYLTITNKRQVNPTAEDLERIRAERAIMDRAFLNWDDSDPPITSFVLPTQGPVSSIFGLKRFFNNQPRNPHSGLDLAAAEGVSIIAPAKGKVTATGNYFFNGNTVLLDHGHGLISMYCHMSRIDVEPGDILNAGETMGAVGKTGRVTGAHLHWSISLNNARIDPNLFLVK